MTSGSAFRCILLLFATVLSVSTQPTALSNNVLQFKAPYEQYHFRQGYLSGPQYHETTKLNVLPQSVPHHDFTQKTRNTMFADEISSHLQPVDLTATSSYQPSYYPLQFGHQKDHATENPSTATKLLGLANVLMRAPRPETVKSFDQVACSSEIHQEVCAPPKPSNPPQPTPCPSQPQCTPPASQIQLIPPSPCPQQPVPPKPTCPQQPVSLTPPCPQQPLSPTPKCQCNQQPLSPTCSCSQQPLPSTLPSPQPKPEVHSPPIPAPKFIPSKNPFQPEQKSPDLSKPSFVSVSPLHASSKYPETALEAPCASPTPYIKKTHDFETQRGYPVVPAEKPVVPYNPFSENKRERKIPLPNPKGILHHRLHADEHLGYPEGYSSKPESQSKPVNVPYLVTYPEQYQTVGGVVTHLKYPYIPLPDRKPIPLVVPSENEVEENYEDEQEEVSYSEDGRRSPKRYEDDRSWSRSVLRDIAEKLGAILDEEEFRSSRRNSRRYPEAGRGHYGGDERNSRGNYARGYGDYYEEDYGNNGWKEKKRQRGAY